MYLKSSMSWQVGAAPHSYTFSLDSTQMKQRKLQIEEVKAQTVSIDESSSDDNEDDIQPPDLANIKVRVSILSKSSSSCLWMDYLKCFANCHLQRSNTQIGFTQTFCLIQMVAAFACSEHFVTLKATVAHYCVLGLEEVLKAPLDVSSHLYKVGLWTEHLELINVILQWLVRAHFTSLINEGKDLLWDRSEPVTFQNRCAVIKVIKATVVKIYSRMKSWDSSNNPAERSAFLDVQHNLWRWRQEGTIWSLLQNKFSSLTLLALVPHYIWIMPTTQSISESL